MGIHVYSQFSRPEQETCICYLVRVAKQSKAKQELQTADHLIYLCMHRREKGGCSVVPTDVVVTIVGDDLAVIVYSNYRVYSMQKAEKMRKERKQCKYAELWKQRMKYVKFSLDM